MVRRKNTGKTSAAGGKSNKAEKNDAKSVETPAQETCVIARAEYSDIIFRATNKYSKQVLADYDFLVSGKTLMSHGTDDVAEKHKARALEVDVQFVRADTGEIIELSDEENRYARCKATSNEEGRFAKGIRQAEDRGIDFRKYFSSIWNSPKKSTGIYDDKIVLHFRTFHFETETCYMLVQFKNHKNKVLLRSHVPLSIMKTKKGSAKIADCNKGILIPM